MTPIELFVSIIFSGIYFCLKLHYLTSYTILMLIMSLFMHYLVRCVILKLHSSFQKTEKIFLIFWGVYSVWNTIAYEITFKCRFLLSNCPRNTMDSSDKFPSSCFHISYCFHYLLLESLYRCIHHYKAAVNGSFWKINIQCCLCECAFSCCRFCC